MLQQFYEDVRYIVFSYLSCEEYQFLCGGKLDFKKYFKFRGMNLVDEDYGCSPLISFLVSNTNYDVDYMIDACCKNGYLSSLMYFLGNNNIEKICKLSIKYNKIEILKYYIAKYDKQNDSIRDKISFIYILLLFQTQYKHNQFYYYYLSDLASYYTMKITPVSFSEQQSQFFV